jgi:hypothetical protein
MPLPNAPDYSQRIYELLKETDLENLSYSQYQSVVEKLFIEPENEDEMRRAVLIQMARMAVRGSWDGFLSGGGGGGSIGGSITDNQIAVGATTADEIEGSSNLTFDGSVLSVLNQLDIGGVGAAGIVKNSNTNQDLELRVLGTGNVRIKNETTNTDSQLNVQSNGSGTPKVSLSNDTKAVTLQCDDNQKLTVKGGTDTFVLDVSSSSSGLKFPDGSIQTTAASGGSSGIPAPTNQTTSQGLAVTAYWLLGLYSAQAMENEAYTTGTSGFAVKWSPPFTGTTGITMGINVAAAADTNYLWIYEESSTGWAGTFVAKIKMPTTSTGLQTESQWLDATGSNITSPTFTQGTNYLAVLEVASGFTAASGRQAYTPFVLLGNAAAFTNPSAEFYNYQYTGTIDASLPDSDINFLVSTVGWPLIGLEL